MYRRLAVRGLVAAQRGQADRGRGDDKAVAGVIIRRAGLAQRLAELRRGQRDQPGPVHRAVCHLAHISRLAALAVQDAEAGRRQAVRLAVVIQLACLVPLDRAVRLALGEGRVHALILFRIQAALAAVQAERKAALVIFFTLLGVFDALALELALGIYAAVMHRAAVVILGALARLHAGRERPLVSLDPHLVERSFAFEHAGCKVALVHEHTVLIGGAGALTQAVGKLALIGEQAALVIFLPPALQQPLFELALIERDGFGFVRIHDHPAGPVVDPGILHIEMRGQEMAQNERPHHKIDQQPQRDQADRQREQKLFGDEQSSGLHIVAARGRLFCDRRRRLERIRRYLGRLTREIGEPLEARPQTRQLAGEKRTDGAEEYPEGPQQLCQQMVQQNGFLPRL